MALWLLGRGWTRALRVRIAVNEGFLMVVLVGLLCRRVAYNSPSVVFYFDVIRDSLRAFGNREALSIIYWYLYCSL